METREASGQLGRRDDDPYVEAFAGPTRQGLNLNLTVQDVDELIARLEQQPTRQLGANVGETSPD